MPIEILVFLFAGIIAGTFTGLIPGIHINLVAVTLVALSSGTLSNVPAFNLSIFIVSMAITHTFIDFIPSIFLGAPEDCTALGVLPGHRLLMKGHGYEAVKLSLIGSYFGLLLMLIITPFVLFFLPATYEFIKQAIPYLLILASSFLILKEKDRFWAFFIFMLSGILGIITLHLTIIKQPLFPLLTGLFGISILFDSIKQKTKIPKQTVSKTKVSKLGLFRALTAGIVASPLCSFLPGLGAAQAAVLGLMISGKLSRKEFLVLLGSINTIVMGLTFVALYSIQKSRSGTAAAVNSLMNEVNITQLIVLLMAMLVAGSLAIFVGIVLAKSFSKHISKFNYSKICMGIILFLILMTLIISGAYSLIVLITATAIGIFTIRKKVRRMNLMGCLIIPAIIWLI